MLIECRRAKPGRRIVLEEGTIVYPEEGQTYRVLFLDGQALIATGDFVPTGEGLTETEPAPEPLGVIDIVAEGSSLGTGGRVGAKISPEPDPEAEPDADQRETQELTPCRDC